MNRSGAGLQPATATLSPLARSMEGDCSEETIEEPDK